MLNKIYYYVKSEEIYLSDGGMTDERKDLLCYRTQGFATRMRSNKIKAALEHEIDAAVTDGFTCFMSGFADGVDQYFAELVLEKKAD